MTKQYQHIDLTYLHDFSKGNKNFITEIISISIEQTQQEINNLKIALLDKNYKALRLICHKLKSSMGFMGINPEILERLKEIESLSEEKTDALNDYTEQIITACLLINEDLADVLLENNL